MSTPSHLLPSGLPPAPSAGPAASAATTLRRTATTLRRTAAGLPRRLWRGHEEDPAWARPALLAVLVAALVLYLYDLGASGYANSFYSAAVQAGSQSWKAFFFGSSDAANSITVDKPPAALWPMALSVRLFGLGSWQILVPEALMGAATVGLLYAAVRRRFGPGAGLTAAVVLALTPVATLMFRFNNPDALLALLMVAALYFVLRALEDARLRWLLAAGAVFGLAFLTKTLQAWLILPPLAVVYAVCAPTAPRRRLLQLLAAGGAMVLAGGWWVAIVELWPASSRPYIGGSQDNDFLSLTFGYNGFGRITGNETGSVGGGGAGGPGGAGGGMWGRTGIGRLFGTDMGGQIAWLLPAAFALLVAGLWITRREPRTGERRAAFLVWGGALLATFVTFSFMSGIFHQYYNIALAPYIAALTGMGGALLWRRRDRLPAAVVLAAVVLGTGVWAAELLGRSAGWHPWLRYVVVAAGLLAALAVLAGTLPATAGARARGRLSAVAAAAGVVAMLGGPAAYTLETVSVGHEGSIITAGPAVQGAMGGPGGGGGFPGGGQGGMRGGTGAPAGGMPGGAGGPNSTGGSTGQGQGQFGAPAARVRRTARASRASRAGRASRVVRVRRTAGRGRVRPAVRSVRRAAAPRRHGRWRHERPAQRHRGVRCHEETAAGGRRPLHLGRRRGRLPEPGELPAVHAEAGDGDRRLQRHRPLADAGPVREVRRRRPHPLPDRRRWLRWRVRRRPGRPGRPGRFGYGLADPVLGRGALHGEDGRRHHRVRPDRPEVN